MELEKQLCSLELAKRLKELGVKQDSYFSWCEENGIWVIKQFNRSWDANVSAFSVPELGAMLPFSLDMPCAYFEDALTRHYLYISCGYTAHGLVSSIAYDFHIEDDSLVVGIDFDAGTEADSRAKMLIYLIENKLVTL